MLPADKEPAPMCGSPVPSVVCAARSSLGVPRSLERVRPHP